MNNNDYYAAFGLAFLLYFARKVWASRPRRAPRAEQFPPNSPELSRLLLSAVPAARVPQGWATSPDLHYIIGAESGGWVGIPNYTYGQRNDEAFPPDISDPDNAHLWPKVHAELRAGVKGARSTATGLGQLIYDNVVAYYPEGLEGIGDPWNEAVGYLAYVRARYGTPSEAARVRRDRGNY